MSDIQNMMNFELLPNEILSICFEYFNPFEIFYSFDRLNYRFSKLIRNIRLHLNFENIQKTIFDQFCQIIKSSPEIKKQIYILQLSNKNTCGQIELFLSPFSLNEFSHLQALKLVEIEEQNLIKLKLMLPLLSNLYSFHMISNKIDDKGILDNLPMSNLRVLSILSLHSIKTCTGETSNMTYLTIYACSLEHLLYHMFKYFSMLKYLNIQVVSRYNHPIENENDTSINQYKGVYLKQLIIGLFRYNFEKLEILLKQVPNLRNLTIDMKDDINIIYAQRWKYLIQSSLPYLNIFKFNFSCNRKYNNKIILKLFQHFQDDFWCKQHQWYTECSFEKKFASIYTIPYISNTYQLDFNTKRFSNTSINKMHTFDQVINLTLDHEIIPDRCQDYFSNVKTLILSTSNQNQNVIEKPTNIYYLKMFVNLSNLTYLHISQYDRMLTPSLLLKILKESPQLSQITINSNTLISFFNDDEICKYLKKMIKKLDIFQYLCPSFNNSDELKKFCEIFSNIELLTCYVIQPNDVFFLINHLSKLINLNVYLPPLGDRDYLSDLFEEESHRLNFIFRIEGIELKSPKLSMWIGRNHLFK